MDYLGVYVPQVADNSTFKGVLNIADTVTGDPMIRHLKALRSWLSMSTRRSLGIKSR